MISRKHRGARALSVVAHDVLIRAYPASFRAEYANEMRWAFSHLCADAIASRGLAGLLEVWIDTLVDFPASVIATHRERWQERAPLSWATPLMLTVLPVAVVARTMVDGADVAASFLHLSSVAAYCGAIRLWLAMRGATSAGQRIVFVISCAAASATFLRDTRMCMDALRQSPASIAIGFATIAVPVAAALASLRAAHAYLEVRKPIT
ncbi:MAG: hypothetical protein DMD35_10140 [Gemmatimonadetes bacterium]|nr:MAG: hypothetical protein DMD35_10140 [Gemmatimonadota bacterium]HMC54694.1 hypothetical protein [Gemmatimonadaceae bacterium]